MPIPDFATYSDRVIHAQHVPCVVGNAPGVAAGALGSLWRTMIGNTAPSIPSTAVALDYSALGALPLRAATGARFLGTSTSYVPGTTGVPRGGTIYLCDRLSHQGGLVANVNTLQTTNLPTAALTRYTSGVGVMAAYELYSGIGGTASTITMSYTNQAGVAGQTSQPIVIGGTSSNNATGVFRIFALADGDTGVRSVQSVTLAATTGSAGNFGITLFVPLAMIPVPYQLSKIPAWDALLHMGANIAPFVVDAHLFLLFSSSSGLFTNSMMDMLVGAD